MRPPDVHNTATAEHCSHYRPPPPSRGAGGRGGLGSQGMCPAERTGPSTRCACPDVWRCSTWCRLPRPAQSRPARSAWVRVVAVLRPLIRWRPPRGVASSGKRELNRSLCEGPMRVRGAGLPIERWGHLQLYQGEWNAISAFLGPPPDILGQDPVPAGHVSSKAAQLPLINPGIHSSPLWRL
jgi:hypothetical protein